MHTTYYELIYEDLNHNINKFIDFDKYSLNEAIKNYNFLKSNDNILDTKLFIVDSHKQELTEDQFPLL